jgi:hypothetical protein
MKTVTVICHDHAGVLFTIAEALKKARINIDDISAQSFGDKGAIIISVSRQNESQVVAILKRLGFTPLVQDGLVIRLVDKPGELAKVAKILKKAKINILTLHIISQKEGQVFMALITDEPRKSRTLLKNLLVH